MAGKNKGWVRIDRSIRDSWIWKGEPFSKGQAWMDLLLRAAYEDKTVYYQDHIFHLKRGQLVTSYRQLAKDWGWGFRRTVRYTEMLKDDGMIIINGSTNGSTITIVNWDKFQVLGHTNSSTNDSSTDSTGDSTYDSTNKKYNKVKQYNNARARDARNMIGQFNLSPGMRNDYSDKIAELERMNEERNRQERLSGGSWEDGYEEFNDREEEG